MTYLELQSFFHHHCKIKLRSGKEIFGVLWEELPTPRESINFASFIEHEKIMARQMDVSSTTESLLTLKFEDIVRVEPIVN